MQSCKRTAGLYNDESDQDPVDDDEAKKEIADLETWLNEQKAEPNVPPVGSVQDESGRCVDCGWLPCKCNLLLEYMFKICFVLFPWEITKCFHYDIIPIFSSHKSSLLRAKVLSWPANAESSSR